MAPRKIGAEYLVGWTASEGWTCDCPALGGYALVLALQAVTVRPVCITGG